MPADALSLYAAGESWQTLWLLNDPDDAAYTQSGISSVSVGVTDESDPSLGELFVGTQPTVSATFYDTLQTGSGWNKTPGFNFKHIVAPADVLGGVQGGHVYRVTYTVETQLDGARVVRNRVTVDA